MTPFPPRRWVVEFDAFGVAAGCAVVSGALSVVEPFLDALTGTLSAIALAGWLSLLRRRGEGLRDVAHPGTALGLGTFAAGAVAFLVAPASIAGLRGLLLGLTLIPLWLSERNRSLKPRGSGRAA